MEDVRIEKFIGGHREKQGHKGRINPTALSYPSQAVMHNMETIFFCFSRFPQIEFSNLIQI
jgi:hypothetical protein